MDTTTTTTTASLSSLCSAISHSAISSATDITDLEQSAPAHHHADRLRSLSRALLSFAETISLFDAQHLANASSPSPALRSQLRQSLDSFHNALAPLGKQVACLDPASLSVLNGASVTAYEDLLLTHQQLLRFFEHVLAE